MQVCRKVRAGAQPGGSLALPAARRVAPHPVPVPVPPAGAAGPYPGDEPQDGLRLPDEGLRVKGAPGFPRSEGAPVHGGAGVGGRQAGGSAGGAGLRRAEPGCTEPRRAEPCLAARRRQAARASPRGRAAAGARTHPSPPGPRPHVAATNVGPGRAGSRVPGLRGLPGLRALRAWEHLPVLRRATPDSRGRGWGRCHTGFYGAQRGRPPARSRLLLGPSEAASGAVSRPGLRDKELLERVPQRPQRKLGVWSIS